VLEPLVEEVVVLVVGAVVAGLEVVEAEEATETVEALVSADWAADEEEVDEATEVPAPTEMTETVPGPKLET